ncbi:hypothetical protein Q8A73_012577 [Channa argus]|nr:hypothetical protein Q8A73_012577 [Channa argus]
MASVLTSMLLCTCCCEVFFFVLIFIVCLDQVDAKPGEDIVLQCQAPRGAAIGLIQWTRPDLKSGDVFFYRDGNSHDNYQHASFRGRVKLRDPQMKDGDVSVILQNVTINDAGRYDCRTIINSGSTEPATPQLMNNIHLTESGHTPGNITDGENTRGHYLLFVPFISCIAVVLGLFLKITLQNSNIHLMKNFSHHQQT